MQSTKSNQISKEFGSSASIVKAGNLRWRRQTPVVLLTFLTKAYFLNEHAANDSDVSQGECDRSKRYTFMLMAAVHWTSPKGGYKNMPEVEQSQNINPNADYDEDETQDINDARYSTYKIVKLYSYPQTYTALYKVNEYVNIVRGFGQSSFRNPRSATDSDIFGLPHLSVITEHTSSRIPILFFQQGAMIKIIT